MLVVMLLLQLSATSEVKPDRWLEPRSVGVEAREQTRLRGGLHLAFAGALSGFALGFGPGLSAELGATFADRFSAVARLTVGTIFVATLVSLGVGLDFALSDQVSVGVAPGIGVLGGQYLTPRALSVALFAPVRVVFSPFARAADQVARKGLVLFIEGGPGFGLVMNGGASPLSPPASSPVSVQAAVGIGSAVW